MTGVSMALFGEGDVSISAEDTAPCRIQRDCGREGWADRLLKAGWPECPGFVRAKNARELLFGCLSF